MNRNVFLLPALVLYFLLSNLNAQIAPNTYWIKFTDKNNSEFSIDKPEEFLTERAIVRRIKQGIAIDQSDMPVNQNYLDSLIHLGIKIHSTSKWLNGATIVSTDTALLDTIHKISFIKDLALKNYRPSNKSTVKKKFLNDIYEVSPKEIVSDAQLEMLNTSALHERGFMGEGILISILDAGFRNAELLESVQHVWNNNRVIAVRDIVGDGENLLTNHSHGTMVFSIIAANWKDNLQGIAPNAEFMLIRTENDNSEFLIEEYNWVAGAEFADSMGTDIITSSLGYSTFDNSAQNHTYEDLDGKTVPISIAASIAARKGILVVSSAGNSGNDPWFYITAPGDADSILTVGAVNSSEQIAPFSSRGPSYDNRIKPDVCAMGVITGGQVSPGSTTRSNGTSFSAPLIAGFAASLWQTYPHASAQELRNAIINSGHLSNNPDNVYGYGIPNASLALNILKNLSDTVNTDITRVKLYPNPTNNRLNLWFNAPWIDKTEEGTISIYNINGKELLTYPVDFSTGFNYKQVKSIEMLYPGYYLVKISIAGRFYQMPFIKFD